MTQQYDPFENAIAERVNGILKYEFIRGITTNDLTLVTKLVEQSINIYNKERPHWSCYMKTPEYMHQQNQNHLLFQALIFSSGLVFTKYIIN